MHSLSTYEPARNDNCLCGSGRKFKKCCMAEYRDGVNSRASDLYNHGHFEEALEACRRHLTWYILCHRAHTVPFYTARPREAAELLTVDIEALASLIDLLFRCHLRVAIGSQFPSALDSVIDLVADRRWHDKIQYFHALWLVVEGNDERAAFDRLSLLDIDACVDAEILALYWETTPEELGLPESIALLDRIIATAEDEASRLRYSTLKGIELCLISETASGCTTLRRGIDRYRSAASQDRSAWGDQQFAVALEVLGVFAVEAAATMEAVAVYRNLIDAARAERLTDGYLADLLKSLGECLTNLGDFEGAKASYDESLALGRREIVSVFVARAQVQLGRIDEARVTLKSVDSVSLDEGEGVDYAFAWATLAAASLQAADLERARSLLKVSVTKRPYFERLRQEALIALLEATPKQPSRKLSDIVLRLNRYILLNISIFGVGINLNKIIEDIGSRRRDVR